MHGHYHMTEAIQVAEDTMVGSIAVVGVLTWWALLYSMWELKTAQATKSMGIYALQFKLG